MTRSITGFLWLTPPLLQTWLFVLLVRKRAVRVYRFFSIYTVFAVVAELMKFSVRNDFRMYGYVFLVTQPVYALLGYLAVAEVFYYVFRNFHSIKGFKFLFPGIGVLALAISVWISALHPPVQASQFLATMLVLEIVVRCLQLGVFFLFFGLAKFYDLFWRQYSFGIASGFGVASFGILVLVIVRSEFGTNYAAKLQLAPSVAYLFAVVIWLISFLKPLPADPLQNIRPMFTPDVMREWAEGYRQLKKDIFKLCWNCSRLPFSLF